MNITTIALILLVGLGLFAGFFIVHSLRQYREHKHATLKKSPTSRVSQSHGLTTAQEYQEAV